MTQAPEDDWRLANVEALRGRTLVRRPYFRWSPDWDHDHCSACWAKFALDLPGALTEGYATGPDDPRGEAYEWICPACFDELREVMGWRSAALPDATASGKRGRSAAGVPPGHRPKP